MSKQIKVLLKTAKQSIQEKKYGEALENCKVSQIYLTSNDLISFLDILMSFLMKHT